VLGIGNITDKLSEDHLNSWYSVVIGLNLIKFTGMFTCNALPPSRHPTGSILKAVVVKPHLKKSQQQ